MPNNSFDFTNLIRDVDVKFDTFVQKRPSFLSLLGGLSTTLNPITKAPVVTNTKHEWINDSLGSYSSAITGFVTDGDGDGLILTSTSGLQVGSILRFTTSTGASRSELVRVVSIDSGTTITVSRDYAGTTGVTLATGNIAYLVSTPKLQGSTVGNALKQEGVVDFNYTQIFDEAASLTNTALASQSYDGYTAMSNQANAALIRMAMNLEDASIFGHKVAPSAGVAGAMSGVLAQISAAGGNIQAAGGGAISTTLLNNTIEDIVADGGSLFAPVILCAPNQARKLSALNTAGTNPIVYKDNADRSLGNFVTSFVGDLPIGDSSAVAKIMSCQRMAKDQIAILDMNYISLEVMRGLSGKDATVPGADEYVLRYVTELTLKVKNATKAHGLITGLAL